MEKRNQNNPARNRAKKQYSIFDANYLWQIFTHHKKWFALSVFLCLCLGAAYVYLTRPAYNIVGKMLIIDRRQNSSSINSVSAALLNQLPSSLGSSLNLGRSLGSENEKEILKTKLLAKDVVEDLGLYTEIRHQKFLKSRSLYKNTPVNVTVSKECLHAMNEGLKTYSIRMTIDKSDAGFTFEGVLKKNKKKAEIAAQSFAKLPAVIHTEIGDLTFTENVLPTDDDRKPFEKDYRLKVTVIPPMTAAKLFVKRLTIASASKKATSIIQINLQDENVSRGIDFINSLVEHYNDRSNAERQEEAAKNDEFINSRLAKIDQELGLTDADWEKVKKQYHVTDPKVDAEEVMEKKSGYESQLVNFSIQQQLIDYLSEYVNDPANLFELIPVNVGVYTGDAVSMINQHNTQVTERNLLLKSVSEKSSQVQQLNQLIRELHPAIQTALQRDRQSLAIRRRTVEQEYNRYKNRVGSAPEQERVMTDVSRQRNIKQGVFVSLLQKREEIAMELANTTDKGRLIDETQMLKKASPNTLVALLLSSILGVIIPFVYFFSRRSVKKQIESEVDVKLITKLPLVGMIPTSEQKRCDDAFRILRTNLLHQLREGQKTILFISANEGDGKTFCAARLAKAFGQMGEKTIVCDLNFRHPSLAKELSTSDSSRLVTLFQKEDFIQAGVDGSAHPTDILSHRRLREVLAHLRESYDIVILDTPAAGKNIDILMEGLGDLTCFVCCSGKTSKSTIEKLDKIKEENRLASPCIVLNQM